MPTHRTALITGANRGIGSETARQLAKAGFHVILTGRMAHGEDVAKRITASGHEAEWRPLDIADERSVAELAQGLERDGLKIDALVNNAGILLDGFNADLARHTVDVNFFGTSRVTDALLPLVSDAGNVVLVSSGMGQLASFSPALRTRFLDAGLTREALDELMNSFVRDVENGVHENAGWPSSAYRVSKAGLNALARILAPTLRERHINVNAVCPGWVRTDMGGPTATRSIEEGASSVVWAALLGRDEATGGYFRDGKPLDW